jgi:hypothetical protein
VAKGPHRCLRMVVVVIRRTIQSSRKINIFPVIYAISRTSLHIFGEPRLSSVLPAGLIIFKSSPWSPFLHPKILAVSFSPKLLGFTTRRSHLSENNSACTAEAQLSLALRLLLPRGFYCRSSSFLPKNSTTAPRTIF